MIFIDDAEILSAADPVSIVNVLRDAFQRDYHVPDRLHYDLEGDDNAKLLLMPSWDQRSWIGLKILTVIPSNADRSRPTIDGLYLLLDGLTGSPRALLSGPALTAVRTAGVCALATSLLARPDAATLLMIGAGALAPYLVRSYCAVRPIKRVILWARDGKKALNLADLIGDLDAEIELAESLSDAVGKADIIGCATSSRTALIHGAGVTPGTHVDLIGSFSPDMRESDSELMRRARLFVDTRAAFVESGDLLLPVREGVISNCAPDIATLLQNPAMGRQGNDEITVFKSVGNALADLAAAQYILKLRATVTKSAGAIDS